MDLLVLDRFSEKKSAGYFCRVNLLEYIENLPENFQEYFVQRGITSNRYLDMLWETLEQQLHIPLIVIVDGAQDPQSKIGQTISLQDDWKILDGLQRTYRLKVIFDAAKYIDELPKNLDIFEDKFSHISAAVKKERVWLKENNCPSALFAKMLRTKAKKPDTSLVDIIHRNNIWLEVWFGLEKNDQIKKMLLLNAGHKSVSIKHQIELLFSSYLPVFEAKFPNKIVRDRTTSPASYSKNRTQGQFFFAHLVTAFESLKECRPVATNADFAADKAHETENFDVRYMDIEYAELEQFSNFLFELDQEFGDTDFAIKWLGREVVLAGLFGAIGSFLNEKKAVPNTLEYLIERLPKFKQWLDLANFEKARNSLDRARVNVGNKNKTAVFKATDDFLKGTETGRADWQAYFNGGVVK